MPLLAVIATIFALPGSGSAGGRATATPLDWPSYGRTPEIANTVPSGLDTAGAATLRVRWTRKLNGSVVAQPLYLASAAVGGGTRPLLFVVTGANVVFALDARSGGVVWERSLGAPVSQVCGGMSGISSTPALSSDHRRLFVIGGNGKLFALDVASGSVVAGWPVTIVTRTAVEYVWSGLRVVGRSVLVPVGSHCDRPDADGVGWNGRLVAVDTATRRVSRTLDVVPGPGNGGSIWGWAGTSWDRTTGTIWTATANATVVRDDGLVEKEPLAERVLALDQSLRVRRSVVQPDDEPNLAGDQGFGGTPMLFRPSGCPALLAINAKSAYMYVWRRDRLGKPLFKARIGPTTANDGFLAQPTWFPSTRTLVVAQAQYAEEGETRRGLAGFRVDGRCRFSRAWTLNVGGGAQPQPLGIGPIALSVASAIGKVAVVESRTGRLLKLLDTGPAYAPLMVAGAYVVSAAADGTVRAFGI